MQFVRCELIRICQVGEGPTEFRLPGMFVVFTPEIEERLNGMDRVVSYAVDIWAEMDLDAPDRQFDEVSLVLWDVLNRGEGRLEAWNPAYDGVALDGGTPWLRITGQRFMPSAGVGEVQIEADRGSFQVMAGRLFPKDGESLIEMRLMDEGPA